MSDRADMAGLTRWVVHDLRNNLYSITMAISLIERDTGATRQTSLVRQRCMYQADLLEAYSDLLETPTPRRCRLEPLVRDCIPLVCQPVQLTQEPELGAIYANPITVKRILVNVMQNAAKASQKPLHVYLSNCTEEERKYVSTSVRDYGPGLPFDPATYGHGPTTPSCPGGTGIGTMIARALTEHNCGRIKAYNMNPGTTVEILLPCPSENDQTCN